MSVVIHHLRDRGTEVDTEWENLPVSVSTGRCLSIRGWLSVLLPEVFKSMSVSLAGGML